MKTSFKYAFGVAIALTIGGLNASASIDYVLDNTTNEPFGAGMVANFSEGEETGYYNLAQGFTTGGNSYVLDTVTLSFEAIYGTGFQLALYSDSGNLPGSQVALFNGPSTPDAGLNMYTAASSVTLDPLTAYWLVATAGNPGDMFYLTSTADHSYATTDGWSVNDWLMDPGNGWSPNGVAVIKFAVGAPVQIVPEPTSVALAGLAGFGLLLYFRRK